jgi:F-type H+-transporting ATPase subunit b
MPQLNPEFFISQLFWLVLTFTFLFIFLWRISLPRISSVLEKRESKVNDDIAVAKQLQTEAEEIQKKIDNQLRQAKSETAGLIKSSTTNFQNHAANKLQQLDGEIDKKLEESATIIEKNKIESLQKIHAQIYEITKLALSKISTVSVSDNEIKEVVDTVEKKVIH